MDGLTAQDWNELAEAALMLGAYAGVVAIFTLLKRWRNGQPMLHTPLGPGSMLDHSFLIGIILMMSLHDFFGRRGIPDWAILGALIAGILIVGHFAMRTLQGGMAAKASETGIANPEAGPAPPVPPSAEERKVSLRANALLVASGFALIAPLLSPLIFDFKPGTAGLIVMLLYCIAALGLLGWAISGHWPRPIEIRATIEIEATPEKVWNTLRYVGEEPYYKPIIRRVESLDGQGTAFRLHYFNLGNCGECGLVMHPDTPGATNRVEVLEARASSFYKVRAWPKGMGLQIDGMMDHEDESFVIDPLPGGRSRVTNIDRVERPRVWAAALLKLGDPLGEHLRNLKAHIEGGAGETVWDTGAARIEAARRAPKFCGCPA